MSIRVDALELLPRASTGQAQVRKGCSVLKRMSVSLKRDPALTATRVTIGKEKLVYILVADRKLKYAKGKSRVAYIGTTKKGVARVAQSVAYRANKILTLRGVKSFAARIVTCQPRQNVSTWLVLERALLIAFKEKHGEVPECNAHGKSMKERDEFRYFSRTRVRAILDELG